MVAITALDPEDPVNRSFDGGFSFDEGQDCSFTGGSGSNFAYIIGMYASTQVD